MLCMGIGYSGIYFIEEMWKFVWIIRCESICFFFVGKNCEIDKFCFICFWVCGSIVEVGVYYCKVVNKCVVR